MLTDTEIRKAKSKDKPYKLSDNGGLQLLVTPAGGKLWRLAYCFGGKQCGLAFGKYPEVSLATARTKRDSAKAQLADNRNPAIEHAKGRIAAINKASNTFRLAANLWLEKKFLPLGRDAKTVARERLYIELFCKHLGNRPITDIDARDLLDAIERQQSDHGHHEAANRMLSTAKRVFAFAIQRRLAVRNPALDIAGALTTTIETKRPALTEPIAVEADGRPCRLQRSRP
jgi:hypothetical protein